MSGGSMNYLYSRIEYDATFNTDTTERRAFKKHLALVAKALHYDEVTGIFTWKAKTAICITIGSHPKHICKSGYLQISIFKKRYYAHRLAWLYVYGEFPKKFIDHINGIKTDNRIINLREASISENNQNQKLPSKNNTSGLLGVCYAKKYKKWQSQIEINNKSVFIGYFDTKEEAHIAYINKKRELHPFNTL